MAKPCHALGGAGHRCDGPPRRVIATFNRGAARYFRWCPKACREALDQAKEEGEELRLLYATKEEFGEAV